MDLDPWIYALLFVTAWGAGLVDAVAGGGGVLSLPVLLSVGFPVPVALGTNKLQASFGSGTAATHYVRGGLVTLRECRWGIGATLLGSAAGAAAVHVLDPALLGTLIPWLLAAIVVYTIARPQVGKTDHPPRMHLAPFSVAFGLGLGFYDGFFGPGVGSFWTIAFVAVQGFNFAKATGFTKVMNFTSNVTALAVFLVAGQVHFAAGLVMAVGQILGSRMGARLVMTRGARVVRPLFLVMATLTVARLLYVQVMR